MKPAIRLLSRNNNYYRSTDGQNKYNTPIAPGAIPAFFFFFLSSNASRLMARHVCDVTHSPKHWPGAPQHASERAVGTFSEPPSQRTTIVVKGGPTCTRAEHSPPTGCAPITTTRTWCQPFLLRTLAMVPAPSPTLCLPDDAVVIIPSALSSKPAAVAAFKGAPAATPGVAAVAGLAALLLAFHLTRLACSSS